MLLLEVSPEGAEEGVEIGLALLVDVSFDELEEGDTGGLILTLALVSSLSNVEMISVLGSER